MRMAAWTALAMMATLAAASAQTATPDEQAACKPDVRKFCASVKQGDNAAYQQCLQTNFQQLSQKCQQVLMNHKS